jgi:hypothetical protein
MRTGSSVRMYLREIHAHRVVGAADRLGVDIAGARRVFGFLFALGRRFRLGLVAFVGVVAIDDVDPLLVEHGERVFDLLGRVLFRRQRRVDLVVGHIAALAAARDHLLDRRGHPVHQGAVGRFGCRGSRGLGSLCFRCHAVPTSLNVVSPYGHQAALFTVDLPAGANNTGRGSTNPYLVVTGPADEFCDSTASSASRSTLSASRI